VWNDDKEYRWERIKGYKVDIESIRKGFNMWGRGIGKKGEGVRGPELQRQNAENLKQIFPEKEYRGLSPNFYIHVSVSDLYFPTMGSACSAGGNM
jgi:hypothetical protein